MHKYIGQLHNYIVFDIKRKAIQTLGMSFCTNMDNAQK